MPMLHEVADGHEIVYLKRVEDLEEPRTIRVAWRNRATGEQKSRRLKSKVRWVVMDDGGLFSFYNADRAKVEEFLGDYSTEVAALFPGFNKDHILRYEQRRP
jgi:hypothetical protein